ncbi:MAG: SDR family NAD(P)-dependent oxidoreductase [Bacteroidota bacterium]
MIVVTGGTGLVGAHLLFELARTGKKVRAIRRKPESVAYAEKTFSYYSSDHQALFSRIEWVEGDVTDIHSLIDAMQEAEVVYHCAGMISYNPREVRHMMKVNVEGSANVANACLETGIRKLCHVSSVAAFGFNASGKTITETSKWRSSPYNSNYDISKYGGEREIWRAAEEGLGVVIVNPSIILGPGRWTQGSPQLFDRVYKGLKIYTRGSAGYIDVRDVVRAMVRLTESDVKNQRYILSAENHPYKFFLEKVADALGRPRPRIEAGSLLLGLARRLDAIKSLLTGQPQVITKEITRGARNRTYYSSEKIKQQLGMSFIPVERSIKEIADIYLKEFRG